jgi:hypothetical protein
LLLGEIGPEGVEILSLLFTDFGEKGVKPGFFTIPILE